MTADELGMRAAAARNAQPEGGAIGEQALAETGLDASDQRPVGGVPSPNVDDNGEAPADGPIDDEIEVAASDVPALTTTPYDPEKKREDVRGRIVAWLLAILGLILVVPLIAILFGRQFSEFKDYLTLVLTSVVGLVGTAVGFYYGGKAN